MSFSDTVIRQRDLRGLVMDDTPVWDLDFTYNGIQAVKVSCHAGDFGSVAVCNMVGDQPLFYIDDTVDDDDFMILEDHVDDSIGFPIDEKFMVKMRAKLESYDKTAKALSTCEIETPDQKFDSIFSNSIDEKHSLKSILDYGQKSAVFKSYLDFMIKQKIEIELSDDIQTSFYNRTTSKIILNPALGLLSSCISLLKSMRMAWNHKQGVLINPLSFQPEEAILVHRILNADLDVTKISFLWDLKLAGDEDAWNIAMGGSDYDLCSAYAMEAMTDFRSIKGGLAPRATFEKWFLSSRCKNFDREIIQTMMGGHTDVDIDSVDASRVVAMDVIAGFGHRPDGQNYLSPIVTQIMSDTLFTEVRDRSNANFLWFVTFERRMSQMEQELQEDVSTTESNHNNVLSLPQDHANIAHEKNGNGVASIFFLDHFRAG